MTFLQKNSVTSGANTSRRDKKDEHFVVAKNSTGKVLIPKIKLGEGHDAKESIGSS